MNNPDIFDSKNKLPKSSHNAIDLDWKSKKFFVYEAVLKNETERKIKGIAWHYVFSDLENKNIIERHKFTYLRKVGKGKKVTLQEKSQSPPTNLVSANELKKDVRSPFFESVEVKCIVFSDNEIWKSKDTPNSECEELFRLVKQREDFIKTHF